MAFEYIKSTSGHEPLMVDYLSGAALAKNVAVGLQGGKLVLATAATTGAISVIGVTQKASTAADQVIPVVLAGPSDIFLTTGSGTCTKGVCYDTDATGLMLQHNDVTNPKFKVLDTVVIGSTTYYKVVNISFDLAGSTA